MLNARLRNNGMFLNIPQTLNNNNQLPNLTCSRLTNDWLQLVSTFRHFLTLNRENSRINQKVYIFVKKECYY